ncbi:zinc-ribbon domain-containing protein [Marisediminicola sp. LYQ134]|uniref:zinc-ribbon domain-containing protein n=1 Tax=Marisediminicola sp. LYQ134 TaxID=3391061 RepID=UPI00398311C8
MNTHELLRPYPFTVKPAHLETAASYTDRLLAANFENDTHRRQLERISRTELAHAPDNERWNIVLAAKAGRDLHHVLTPHRARPIHPDGTTCSWCVTGITDRVMCTLCANGETIAQHPHFEANICITHRRWVGPGTTATQQSTVNDACIRAERQFQRLRRENRIDATLYSLLTTHIQDGAAMSGPNDTYPKVIALAAALTSDAFGLPFFNPARTFTEAHSTLETTIADTLGAPNRALADALWFQLRPSALSLRESIANNTHYALASAHDLPIHPTAVRRFRNYSGDLEPFENYLGVVLDEPLKLTDAKHPAVRHHFAPSTAPSPVSFATICAKGHRTSRARKSTCGVCNGRTIHAGYNDLGTKRSDVAAQWHPTRNGNVTPADVFPASSTKYWWLCPAQQHSFHASPSNRTSANSGCPVCIGRIVEPGRTDLKTLYPKVAAEWNYEKNRGHNIDTIAPGSNTMLWWNCPAGHTYRKTIGNRTRTHVAGEPRNTGCHVCPRVKDRRRTIAAARPDLAEQWDHAENGDLTPENVTIGSSRQIAWRCPDGDHQYTQRPERRHKGYGCPFCSGQAHEVGINDFTTLFPRLASEWNRRRNGVIEPCDRIARTRKVSWECHFACHVVDQTTQNRIKSAGCPQCAPENRVGF